MYMHVYVYTYTHITQFHVFCCNNENELVHLFRKTNRKCQSIQSSKKHRSEPKTNILAKFDEIINYSNNRKNIWQGGSWIHPVILVQASFWLFEIISIFWKLIFLLSISSIIFFFFVIQSCVSLYLEPLTSDSWYFLPSFWSASVMLTTGTLYFLLQQFCNIGFIPLPSAFKAMWHLAKLFLLQTFFPKEPVL